MKVKMLLAMVFTLMLVLNLVACNQVGQSDTPTVSSTATATAVTPGQTPVPTVTTVPIINDGNTNSDAVLAAFEAGLAKVYTDALPSVVDIRVTQAAQVPFGSAQVGEGSGFVWSAEGHIVTNNHVVEGADTVTVAFSDGTIREATVLGTDVSSDIAVIKIDPPSGLTALPRGDSSQLKVGQIVVAIGNPFSQNFTLTFGVVSALGRNFENAQTGFSNPNMIQTDAAINPGNSGGPLLDRTGHVIGINASIISDSGGNAGIGFAIPINTVKRIVPSLITDGRYAHSYMGLTGMTMLPQVSKAMGLPEDTRGAMVISVVPDGPADKAGLEGAPTRNTTDEGIPYGGDVITAIESTAVTSMDDVIALVADNFKPGDVITLDVLRENGEQASIDLTLGERPR